MPVLGRRIQNLKKYAKKHIGTAATKITNAMRFVFASIVCSMEFASCAGFSLLNDIIPPSESAYYRAEKNCC